MNHAQKTILLVGTIVIAVMGVYPPWLRVEPNQSAQSMGYGLLWSPPFENRSERARLFGFELQVDMGPVTANKIDWSRLLAQWATIAVLRVAELHWPHLGKPPHMYRGRNRASQQGCRLRRQASVTLASLCGACSAGLKCQCTG